MVIVQTLWIGDQLKTLELLTLYSYRHHGFRVHLYRYEPLNQQLPDHVAIKDARRIVPKEEIDEYQYRGGLSAFSNYFRYMLLYKNGGIWTDLDMVCLTDRLPNQEYIFSSESNRGETVVNTGFIRVPKPKSKLMHLCVKRCRQLKRISTRLKWGSLGPKLLGKYVARLKLGEYTMPAETFCPIPHLEIGWLFDSNGWRPGKNTLMLHLWNRAWTVNKLDSEATYHRKSVFEYLKAKYLP